MNENETIRNDENKENINPSEFTPIIEPIAEEKKPEYKLVKKPYTGGSEVCCPQCKSKVTTRFCPYCGKDMSLCFVVKEMVPVESAAEAVAAPGYNGNTYIPNVNNQAPVFPQVNVKQKKSHFTVALIFTIIGFALIFVEMIFGAVALDKKINPNKSNSNEIVSPKDDGEEKGIGISEEELKKIKEGMSYAHVSQIAGCDGKMIKKGENLNGDSYYVFVWPMEENQIETVCITFVEDKVSDIERNRNS